MSKDWSGKYYQTKDERVQKRACERNKSLSEEEKGKKKRDHGQKQYKNLPEDEKQKLIGYRKN